MSRTSQTLSIFTLAATLLWPGEAHADTVITRVSDGRVISMSQLATDAGRSEVILIGEAHDNKVHHDIELAVIRSLWAKKLPLAIGLEMMQSDSQQQLDDWIDAKVSEGCIQTAFEQNWSLDWDMYRDIFIFARENRIPMIALNVPKQIVKKVAHLGWNSLTADEKRELPQGVTCNLSNPHTAFLRKAFSGMFQQMGNGNLFTYFCEAQTLRDSGMALQIARYLKKHPGRKVVGITGMWHAIKNAIPEQLDNNGSNLAYTVILPEAPELSAAGSIADETDYLIGM